MSTLVRTGGLAQIEKILPAKLLRSWEKASRSKGFAVDALAKSPEALAMLTLILQLERETQDNPSEAQESIDAASSYVAEHAPHLREHPKLRQLAEELSKEEAASSEDERTEEFRPPYDDISSIRSVPMFLAHGDGGLFPVVRLDLLMIGNPEPLTLTLSNSDVAFLVRAMLEGVRETHRALRELGSSSRGVLDPREFAAAIASIREEILQLELEIGVDRR